MVISSALSTPSFNPSVNTNKTHAHKHSQSATNAPATTTTQPDFNADAAADVSAENQVAATPINSMTEAQQVLQAARNAMLQQPTQSLQAQANLDPQTVYALLVQ